MYLIIIPGTREFVWLKCRLLTDASEVYNFDLATL